MVRRRDRLLVAVFWVRDTCVFGRCLFYLRIVSHLASTVFDFRFYDLSTTIFFHNLTDADAFLSFALTLRLFDYSSIPLDPMT